MFFRLLRELAWQISRAKFIVILSIAVMFVISYWSVSDIRNESIAAYSAQMSFIDGFVCSQQKPFLTFVIPLTVLVINFLIDSDNSAQIILLRKSRRAAWRVCCFKTTALSALYAVFYFAVSFAVSKVLRLKPLINWNLRSSVYYAANEITNSELPFSEIIITSILYSFLTFVLFSLLFFVLKNLFNSFIVGFIAVVGIGFNEAWFVPIITDYSGMFYENLMSKRQLFVTILLPVLISLMLIIAGLFLCGRKEYLNIETKL